MSGRRIVLVGGGHAHVQVLEAFAAAPPDADVTVVVDDPVAMYSGMAPGFVAGQYERRELEIDVRPLADRAGAAVVVARCTRVDPAARLVYVEDGPPRPYDVASFNIGSTVSGLDVPGVRAHALPTRPLKRLVGGVAGLVDAARSHDGSRPFRIAVVGGGVGGVELVFTAQWRLAEASGRPVDAVLIESGPHVLSRQPARLRRRVERLAARRGIDLRTGARVAAVDAGGADLEGGGRVDADAVIWVTGPASHPLFRGSPGVRTDDRGFALARPTLQLDGHDDLFGVGDCITLLEHPDTPKAGVYAVREGPIVTENLRAFLAGHPLRRYEPQSDFLTLLNVGAGRAVGTKWGFTFGGRWVMGWKDRIDRAFMRRFQAAGGER